MLDLLLGPRASTPVSIQSRDQVKVRRVKDDLELKEGGFAVISNVEQKARAGAS